MKNILHRAGLLIAVLTAVMSVTAQSGRKAQDSKKPTAPIEPIKPIVAPETSRIIASDADEYKLVFPTNPIDRSAIKSVKNIHKWYVQYTDKKDRENIVEQLNGLGAQGYKFIAATNTFAAGLVRLGEGQYEYQDFRTESTNLYAKLGFTEENERLAAQGFHYRLNSMTYSICTEGKDIAWEHDCYYEDFFLFEKEKNGKPPLPMSGFISIGTTKGSPEADMTGEIKEKMVDGFLPVAAFSVYEIWLQKQADTDALLDDAPEIKAVRSIRSAGHLKGKINEWASQGFRLAIITNGLAIMYRRQNETAPAKYVWLEARKKSFEKELNEISAQGAIYRATYPGTYGEKRTLIMEAPLNPGEKKRDYKLLQFDFEYKQNADETITRHLTEASKDVVKNLNKLANEGFVARDMLYYDGQFCILLEREAK